MSIRYSGKSGPIAISYLSAGAGQKGVVYSLEVKINDKSVEMAQVIPWGQLKEIEPAVLRHFLEAVDQLKEQIGDLEAEMSGYKR